MRVSTRTSGDRLAVLAGARLDLLKVTPGARSKYVALGGVLLSTGALAAVSMSFALHMALSAWWPLALLLGLGWGVVIVNLDRMLLVGMGHDSSWLRNLGMAVPRLALAVLLGTVISTPLTLQVFSKEIEATMVTLQAEAAQQFTAGLDADPRYAPIPELQQKVADEQAVIASGGTADPNADPLVVAAQAERDAKQAVFDAATTTFAELQAKAQCELDGTCGSGHAGAGDAYLSAAAAAGQQAAVRDAAQAALDASEVSLASARDAAEAAAESADARSVVIAQADLVTDQASLTRLTDARTAGQANFEAENSDNTGILARLEAMDRLSQDRPLVGAAHLVLFLLFLSIELLPVLVKVLLNMAQPAAYDRLVELREAEEVEFEEIRREGRRRAQQARADLVVAAETDRMARELLDREIAARDEAARAAEEAARRKQRRGLGRVLRGLRRRSDEVAPAPAPEVDLFDQLTAGSTTLGMWGTSQTTSAEVLRDALGRPAVPAPRAAEGVMLTGAAADR
ncbi:protein of unknown function [Modestobacter sp. DSM 44400]|uniref:DUF4407 domain-containing protein n=1 Tax=Modestobacter sp. DSM 44400 TaxID=1550230 RepID=UPI00089BA0B0|nr:DUF4407 domain-containing protein [Modestobacter sp. DSM 44400]SDX74416.1 protein of unknown function [Modestobacter sp. DSM 44400]